MSSRINDYTNQINIGISDKFPKRIPVATTTSDGLMSAEDKVKLEAMAVTEEGYTINPATWENNGLMPKEDKKKLDSIEEGANYYIHPEDSNTRHVTDEQIANWNAKPGTRLATHNESGLMSAGDKVKLDSISDKLQNVDIANYQTDGLLSASDKTKLDSIQPNANYYIHPDNENVRHVSDAEKEYWNNKVDKVIVTNSRDGLMPYIDKIKLDGIEPYANNYIHPDNSNTRHVTDEQIARWDAKGTSAIATQNANGLMTKEDKVKLDDIEPNANNYVHPMTHPASMIIEDDNHKFVSTEQIELWNSKVSTIIAVNRVTTTSDGLMSKEDKVKLDNIDTNANNYVHPDEHPAYMITEDDDHKFVSAEQITRWEYYISLIENNLLTPSVSLSYDETDRTLQFND